MWQSAQSRSTTGVSKPQLVAGVARVAPRSELVGPGQVVLVTGLDPQERDVARAALAARRAHRVAVALDAGGVVELGDRQRGRGQGVAAVAVVGRGLDPVAAAAADADVGARIIGGDRVRRHGPVNQQGGIVAARAKPAALVPVVLGPERSIEAR